MYIIEGNIGAGKSTFLKLAQNNIANITVALEPLQSWQGTGDGQSLLANFYQNPKRWAYTFETLTLMSRVREQLHQQTQKTNSQLVERSIYSGYYCFAQNCYEQGFMSTLEWHIYSQWFNFLLLNKCIVPQGFIYLRIAPEVAFERIKKRNRSAESTITLEYLQQVHTKHESFLLHKKSTLPHIRKVPVLILECDEEFETNPSKLDEHLYAVQQFLKTTQPTFKPAVLDEELLHTLLPVQNPTNVY